MPWLSKEGPIPRMITFLATLPVMIKPPMATLSPVWTSARVDMFSSCGRVNVGVRVGGDVGVGSGVGVGIGVGVGVGVGPGLITLFVSRVTALTTAKSRPLTVAVLTAVMEASARMFPMKLLPLPRVVE